MKNVDKPSPYWNPSRKTVSHDDLMAFADRLHTAMVRKGMTQADLARTAFGEVTDEEGLRRVKDRDKVSLYLRGKGLPGEEKMRALAKALDMPLDELAPKISATPRQAKEPKTAPEERFEGVRIEPLGRGFVTLVVNQKLRQEDAAEVYALIAKAAKHVR